MDKRLLNFMLVSMLLFIGYMELTKLIRGPIEGDGAVPEQAEFDAAPGVEANPAGPETAEGATQLAEADAEAEADPQPQKKDLQTESGREPAELNWFTLGSLDPDSGYTMLITFSSQGGAVERIELSDPRYRDLEDKTAYIGHLALTPAGDGVRVNVVGAGTPAANAGILAGDTITKVGEEAVSTPESAEAALRKFKFGAEISVVIVRDGATKTLTLKSMRRPLEVVRPEMMPNGIGQLQQLSYLLTLHQVGHKNVEFGQDEIPGLPSLRNENWHAEVSQADGVTTVEFRFPLLASELSKIGVEGSIEVVKRFSMKPSEVEAGRRYNFDFELAFINKGSENLEIGYRLDGPTGLPLEGWWYSYKTHPKSFGGAGVRDVVWRAEGENHQLHTNPMVTKHLKKSPETQELVFVDTAKQMEYLGVDAQYFTSAILPANKPDGLSTMMKRVDARALSDIDEVRASLTPITFRADSTIVQLPANETTKFDFEIFAGPKHPKVLVDYGMDECIVYGWFKLPALFMGWLLHGLHAVVRNYGISIILLTLLVRACMFPIGRQQAMNAKKMQELTPEIKKIKEKFPNETEKQAKAQQELFRKHNYNPIAGCLPMFLQLPIFIGLYRALSVDIELRQTPLLPGLDWCANLAAPDMLFRWDSLLPFEFLTSYTGYLGPFFNLLPVISTGLFLVHQQLFTPPPTDEQQEMQQKVMKFMMLFMLVLFFKIPAGLCIYFITSSLWALAERMLLPKDNKKQAEQTPISLSKNQPAAASVAVGSGNGNAAVAAKKKRRKRNKK